ncbi:hypothetical protein [Micromonospora sediminicola]|uniref:hypothetical protein n=1 Tax=Micromonospora sediminicola TaxID=946078 RepID=UPI0037A60D20
MRYDDHFDTNPKVTGVVFEEPGALSLHLLANTWAAKQKWPGYVPPHQPATLLCDRELGARWAAALVRAGLWHERGRECADCLTEYAHLPESAAGFVFHHASEYRPPARDRVVPGTPADLSEKRRAAGRKGGRVSADRRKQDEAKQEQANQASASIGQANGQATPKQNRRATDGGQAADGEPTLFTEDAGLPPAETETSCQASGVSKASNLLLAGVSPVPVPGTTSASNEAEAVTGEPTPTQRAFGIARGWIQYRKEHNIPVVAKVKGKDVSLHKLRSLIEPFTADYGDIEIKNALKRIGESIPSAKQMDRALAQARLIANDQQLALPSGYESRGTAAQSDRQVPARENSNSRNARGWMEVEA